MSEGRTSRDVFGSDFGGEPMWGLRELPFPDPVAYWPQTAGWYVVLALIVAAVALVVWWRWRVWQRNAYRRDALKRIDAIDTDAKRLPELARILRACALYTGAREDVASLRGEDWINWLNRSAGRDMFTPADAALIDRMPYAVSLADDVDTAQSAHLIETSRLWVRRHHA